MAKQKLNGGLSTVFLSSLGGALEYYDFVIFSIFAPSISAAFFPHQSSIIGLSFTFALLAIGHASRLLGGIYFGHIGDTKGRKISFCRSASLMALTTFAMGLLPSYDAWGPISPTLFVLLRFLQGISVGGEIPGAYTLVYEHMQHQIGKGLAIMHGCFNVSCLFAHVVAVILVHCLGEQAVHNWGWRIAFISGGMIGLSNIYLRRKLSESTLFLTHSHRLQLPFLALIRQHAKSLIMGIMLVSAAAASIGIYSIMLPSYLSVVAGLSYLAAEQLCLLELVVFTIFSAVASLLLDRWKSNYLLYCGVIYIIVSPLVILSMIVNHHFLAAAVFLNGIGIACYAGVMPSVVVPLFPVEVRQSGISMSYNLGFAVFGGLSPLLSTMMIHATGYKQAPAIVLMIAGMITLIAIRMTIMNRKCSVVSTVGYAQLLK